MATLSGSLGAFPVALTFVTFQLTLTKSIHQSGPGANEIGGPSAKSEAEVVTFTIGPEEDAKVGQMAAIIASLEKLGVLEDSNCYALDRIVRSSHKEGDSRIYEVGVHLRVQAVDETSDTAGTSTPSPTAHTTPAASSNSSAALTDSPDDGCGNLTGTPIRLVPVGHGKRTKMGSANSRKGEDSSRANHKPGTDTRKFGGHCLNLSLVLSEDRCTFPWSISEYLLVQPCRHLRKSPAPLVNVWVPRVPRSFLFLPIERHATKVPLITWIFVDGCTPGCRLQHWMHPMPL